MRRSTLNVIAAAAAGALFAIIAVSVTDAPSAVVRSTALAVGITVWALLVGAAIVAVASATWTPVRIAVERRMAGYRRRQNRNARRDSMAVRPRPPAADPYPASDLYSMADPHPTADPYPIADPRFGVDPYSGGDPYLAADPSLMRDPHFVVDPHPVGVPESAGPLCTQCGRPTRYGDTRGLSCLECGVSWDEEDDYWQDVGVWDWSGRRPGEAAIAFWRPDAATRPEDLVAAAEERAAAFGRGPRHRHR